LTGSQRHHDSPSGYNTTVNPFFHIGYPEVIAPRSSLCVIVVLLAAFLACHTRGIVGAEPTPVVSSATKKISSQDEDSRKIQVSLERHVQAMFREMTPQARRGYEFLTEKVYLPADFNEQVLERLDELGLDVPFSDTKNVSKRLATWRAFGIAPRHDDPTKPLQYVATKDGQFVMNCFACHGGNTYGTTFPGAPNTTYALESLTESVRRVKLKEKIPLTHMDVGSVFMPLGTTVGASNAVMFGVALMNFRDKDLNVVNRTPASMTHHDMDAPPWWHFSRKTHIYADGFAEKGHKGLMQFMLVRQNGPERFREWASDFKDVYEFLSSVKPPRYPLAVDQALAKQGEAIFAENCASCHGTYGADPYYPEINVAIDEIGTDRLRWESLTPKHRKHYGDSWFADYGRQANIANPEGYTPPPLDGIWATAPYFHNGSVPTLWHLLHPEERPKVWRRVAEGLDTTRIGFQIEEFDNVPESRNGFERRWYFDTRANGKSAAGHNYPSRLNEQEKQALIEYLKTL
jgi:mono/diheme cytochrome c family protein